MTKLIQLEHLRDKKNTKKKQHISNNLTFEQEVDNDIGKLCSKFPDMDKDTAVQMASDFYKKYPALMEYVRLAEHILGGK